MIWTGFDLQRGEQKIMKAIRLIILMLWIAIMFDTAAEAEQITAQNEEESISVDTWLDSLEFESINRAAKNFEIGNTDIKTLAYDIITGKISLDFGEICNYAVKRFLNEVYNHINIMRNIIAVSIPAALLHSFALSFKKREAAELGFYVCYISVVALLMASFHNGLSILQNTINDIVSIAKAAVPMLAGLLSVSAVNGAVSAAALSPSILFASGLVTLCIDNVFVPLIKMCALISIVNYLTEKEMLQKLAAFISGGLSIALKALAAAFMAALSLQRAGAAIASTAVAKSVKTAVGIVPVVGDIFSSAVDNAFYWTSAIKSGVGIAVIIFLLFACSVPAMRLCAIIFIYKLTAVLIQPISDSRITECIDMIGHYMFIILAALVTVLIMLLFSVITIITAVS